ncbi:MAG TPA: class I SAM-dependent methyltransferase [Gammaproteobacteria bacterium]|nr:class I SAM-dependent methyltransferase [Gammaproteobacteria bacterium]
MSIQEDNQRHYLYRNVADFFDRRYAAGHEVMAEKKLYALDLLRQRMPPSDTKEQSPLVLDLGCGSGVITDLLDKAGYRVVGADISAIAIETLRRRKIDGFVHDVKNIFPVDDGIYDVVWASDLLELVPDIFLFLSEVHRITKPSGLFIFTVPNMTWWLFRAKNMLGYSSGDLMPPSHCRFWSPRSVNNFFNNEYYNIKFLGGVVPYPNVRGIRRLRVSRVNMLCRDIVCICERL